MDGIRLKVFLDTNVLLDILCASPRPSSAASDTIIQAIRCGYFEGVLTTQSIVDASYVLSRSANYDPAAFGRAILSMLNYLNISGISEFDIWNALSHPGTDFEDDVQFAHADAENCEVIITSDRKFRQRAQTAGMQFFTPEAFVARLRGERSSEP